MNEKIPNNEPKPDEPQKPEQAKSEAESEKPLKLESKEKIPTAAEVGHAFDKLIGKKFETKRILEDEQGIYLWEVEVPGEKDGEVTEYGYMRKGRHAVGGQASETAIHVTYYEDGVPVGGTSAAVYIEGKWDFIA